MARMTAAIMIKDVKNLEETITVNRSLIGVKFLTIHFLAHQKILIRQRITIMKGGKDVHVNACKTVTEHKMQIRTLVH